MCGAEKRKDDFPNICPQWKGISSRGLGAQERRKNFLKNCLLK
jgi:hypothetical protein